jgi:hypothetical protein
VQVFAALVSQLLSEYGRLAQTYDEKGDTDISILAWQTRNILELWVWCFYSTKSSENARRLYEDCRA